MILLINNDLPSKVREKNKGVEGEFFMDDGGWGMSFSDVIFNFEYFG